MFEKLFVNFSFQETLDSILLQLKTIFNPENLFFWDTIKVFFDSISSNPLASIITLAALVGLPYTLYKAKQSNNRANERLDQLMDEMQDFEFEKPLIDLQEKFKDGSIDNSPVIDYDQDVLEVNFDKAGPPFIDEDDAMLQDLESTSFAKQITLDQDVTDDYLSSEPMGTKSNTDEESLDLSALPEEFFIEKEFNQPAEPDVNDEKEQADIFAEDLQIKSDEKEQADIFAKDLLIKNDEKEQADIFAEDLQIKSEDQVLNFVEEDSEVREDDTSQSIDSIIEPEETVSQGTVSPEADDLQTKMEQAIQKLKSKYAPIENEEKEANKKPVPLDINKMKKTSLADSISKEKPEEDSSLPSEISASSDSPKSRQSDSLKKSHVITHLKSFKKNFENQLDTSGDKLKKKENDNRQEQSAFFETIYKAKEKTHPKKNAITDEEYQQSLESFLFLKDQEKPE
jgi:hypothetical protein